MNYGTTFYKRISISALQENPENTITIYNLPYSREYLIEEMEQMRYQAYGEKVQTAIPEYEGNGVAVARALFQNVKVNNGLFSKTSVTTNKFIQKDGGFVFERNDEMPKDQLPQPEKLVAYDLPRKPKTGNFGSDGFDDGDTQLV